MSWLIPEWISPLTVRRYQEVDARAQEREVAAQLRPRSGQVETGSVLEGVDDLLAAAERFDRALGEGRR